MMMMMMMMMMMRIWMRMRMIMMMMIAMSLYLEQNMMLRNKRITQQVKQNKNPNNGAYVQIRRSVPT